MFMMRQGGGTLLYLKDHIDTLLNNAMSEMAPSSATFPENEEGGSDSSKVLRIKCVEWDQGRNVHARIVYGINGDTFDPNTKGLIITPNDEPVYIQNFGLQRAEFNMSAIAYGNCILSMQFGYLRFGNGKL